MGRPASRYEDRTGAAFAHPAPGPDRRAIGRWSPARPRTRRPGVASRAPTPRSPWAGPAAAAVPPQGQPCRPLRGTGRGGWVLVESLVECRRLDARLPVPADRATVHMVDVEHLGPAVHDPLLHRVAQIRPHERRGRVAKGVGAVLEGLVEIAG